jgi:hypothetical protein
MGGRVWYGRTAGIFEFVEGPCPDSKSLGQGASAAEQQKGEMPVQHTTCHLGNKSKCLNEST